MVSYITISGVSGLAMLNENNYAKIAPGMALRNLIFATLGACGRYQISVHGDARYFDAGFTHLYSYASHYPCLSIKHISYNTNRALNSTDLITIDYGTVCYLSLTNIQNAVWI